MTGCRSTILGQATTIGAGGATLFSPMKGVLISGFESHRYDLHVNCDRCGCVVEQFVKLKNKETKRSYLDPNRGSMLGSVNSLRGSSPCKLSRDTENRIRKYGMG